MYFIHLKTLYIILRFFLFMIHNIANYFRFGFALAAAGDVNADGYTDIVIGTVTNKIFDIMFKNLTWF